MYMQQKTGSYRENFSKNTFYRFLNCTKINWMKFTGLLSKKVADAIVPLTSEDRINAFVIDDSLFERTSCKKTELGSRVFDHTTMRYCKGYHLMTLGWTAGNTFLPINSCLLASSKERNIIGPKFSFDGRSLASRRRAITQMKGPDAMIELPWDSEMYNVGKQYRGLWDLPFYSLHDSCFLLLFSSDLIITFILYFLSTFNSII